MTFLTGIVSQAMAFMWRNHPQVQSAPTLTEIFKGHLSTFSARIIDRDKCIENCVQASKNTLQSADCDLSETSKAAIELHLENFNTAAVGRTLYLTKDEAEDLKIRFKVSLCEVVEERWARVMAESFYPILSISDENEQVVAAQKWTQEYFEGLRYFNNWEFGPYIISGEFVNKLAQITLMAFDTYSFEVIGKKMELMGKQAEKDPIAFGEMLEAVEAKRKNDPASLSIFEREYVEYNMNLASCITHYWPNIEKNKVLLKNSIWRGFTLQTFHESIQDSYTSKFFYQNLFKKF